MGLLDTPAKDKTDSAPPEPAPYSRNGRPPATEQEFHLLISELRDENSRSRMREAIWISIIIHLVALFFIKYAPHWLPTHAPSVMTTDEMLKQKDLTYLEQPPDAQHPKIKPETSRLSDKDRVATSKSPRFDKKLLDALRAARMGEAGNKQQPTPPPAAVAQAQQPAQQQPQQQQPQQSNANSKFTQPQAENKPAPNPFKMGSSAGSTIQEAARGVAQNRGGGFGGEYSAPGANDSARLGDVEVLSDTQGVDIFPYLSRVKFAVQKEWYIHIPESARSPMFKYGLVTIEFVIMRDGTLQGMKLYGPSGDTALDRGAWAGIVGAAPFQRLPEEYKGEFLALRFRFYYNPDRQGVR